MKESSLEIGLQRLPGRKRCLSRIRKAMRNLETTAWMLVSVGWGLLGGCVAASAVEEKPKPLLFANYYAWYHDGNHPDHSWAGWTRKESKENPRALSEQRQGEPPRSSAAYPLVGLYDSQIQTPVFEVPTVTGMIPGMIAKKIEVRKTTHSKVEYAIARHEPS